MNSIKPPHLNSEIAGTTLTCSQDLSQSAEELKGSVIDLSTIVMGKGKSLDHSTQAPAPSRGPAKVVKLESIKEKPAKKVVNIKKEEKKVVGGENLVSSDDPRF